MKNLHATDVSRYKVKRLCGLFGKSKQAYYKHDESSVMLNVAQEEFAVSFIKDVRRKDPGIGGSKLWHMYRRHFDGNYPLGRDRFERIVDKYGLKVRKRVRRPRTTDSTHGLPVFPNLIRDIIPNAPDKIWVSDITYITLWHDEEHYGFCYLSLILDAYTEEIVGWCVGPTLDTEYPLKALSMAVRRISDKPADSIDLVHHSGRGCQYASSKYISILKSHGISISMTETGDPKENPKAERINNTIKNELLKGRRFSSIGQVTWAVSQAVKFYNEERPHRSIDMMTPTEAASHTGEIPKKWTSVREKIIKEKQNVCNIPEKCLPLHPCEGFPFGLRPPVNPSQG